MDSNKRKNISDAARDNKRVHRPDHYNWLQRFISQCHVCSKWTPTQHGVCANCQKLKPCTACCARDVPGCFYDEAVLVECTLELDGRVVSLCPLHVPMFDANTKLDDFEAWPIPPLGKQGCSWVFPRVYCIECSAKIHTYKLEEMEVYDHTKHEFDYSQQYKCNECDVKQ